MNTCIKIKQNGGVILEALIAFLVLGAGVLAILYLQGNLTGSSGLSKARAEAMELAKDHTENFRNYIQRDQYLSALSTAKSNEPVTETGVNATYSVYYDNIPTDADEAQLLTVAVRWTGSEGESEELKLQTQLYFMSPIIASAIGEENSGDDEAPFPLLSPFITGKEDDHPSTDDFDNSDGKDDVIMDSFGATVVTNQIKTYYKNLDGGGKSYGNVEVIGFDGEVKLTSFGGIVHKVQGNIIIDSGAGTTLNALTDNLRILASPPSYCVFPICDNGSVIAGELVCPDGSQTAKYVCYVPGDCTYQDAYAGIDDTKLNDCPRGFIPPADDDYEDLNGGWYGRVGNFGIAIHPDDKVCTFETDAESILTPSRSYVKYRLDSGGDIIANEGVNRQYSNQDFFIIRKNQSCTSGLVTSRIEGIPLVGEKNFNRDADGSLIDDLWLKNVVLSEVACDTDPTATDPNVTDGSCVHPID